MHRDTIAQKLIGEVAPKYERASTLSKLDPFNDWICPQAQADPSIQSLRLDEMADELAISVGGPGRIHNANDHRGPRAHNLSVAVIDRSGRSTNRDGSQTRTQ